MWHGADTHIHTLRIEWQKHRSYAGWWSPIHHGRYILMYGDQQMRVRKPLIGSAEARLRRKSKWIVRVHDMETVRHVKAVADAEIRNERLTALVLELQPKGETKEQKEGRGGQAGQTQTWEDYLKRALRIMDE